MSNKILTISIAAYNVEKYLDECLSSLIVDDVLDDIEVLIVDDGSSDNTPIIAKKYCDNYPQTFKLISKENGGYGSTYNESIKVACGIFFKLLDGDDTFDKAGLKQLVNELKIITDTDIDVVFTRFIKFNSEKTWSGINYRNVLFDKKITLSNVEINEGIPMHAVTYRTEILKKSKLVLPEHTLYTDNYYVVIPLFYVRSVIYININVYNYRLGNSNQSVDINSKIRHIKDLEYVCNDLLDIFLHLKSKIGIYEYIDKRMAATLVDYYVFLLLMDTNNLSLEKIKRIDLEIREKDLDLYRHMGSLKRKASFVINVLRKTNYIIYPIIDNIYKKLI